MELPKPLVTVTTVSKVLAGILFVLLPFTGFYLGMRYQTSLSPKVVETPVATTTPTQTPIPSDPTAGWKTYTNEKYGYELQYPTNGDYRVFSCSKYTAYVEGNDLFAIQNVKTIGPFTPCGPRDFAYDIEIAVQNGNLATKAYLDNLYRDEEKTIVETNIANTQGLKIIIDRSNNPSPAPQYQTTIYIFKNGKTYTISLNVKGEMGFVFDQILSTFKFTQ